MHRIVSLIASATEIVAALGFEDSLVGVSHECDYPPSIRKLPACSSPNIDVNGSSREIDDRVKAVLADALSVYRVHTDLLVELRPTVIITQTQCEVCAVSLQDVEAAVCGAPTAGWSVDSQPEIVALEPNSLEDVWNDIRRVAHALDARDSGAALVGSLQHRLRDVAAKVVPCQSLIDGLGATASLPSSAENTENTAGQASSGTRQTRIDRAVVCNDARPSVACIEWIDPLMAAGNWVPELVELAGGRDCLGRAGRHSSYMTFGDLAEANPDVIAIMPCGFDIKRTRQELPALTNPIGWSDLRAVRNGRVYVTDGNQYFNRPGPRLVESAEILAEILHFDRVDFNHVGSGWSRL